MLLVIVGPTGVGKTKLSEHLAKKLDAVIINADAVQVYKELNIGSAKPKEEEKCSKEHLLFDIKSVTEDYTVCDYQKDLRDCLKKYSNKNIILVGGSGLYINAGLFDYEFDLVNEILDLSKLSDDEVYNLALAKDSNLSIHKNNRVRLERFINSGEAKTSGNNLLYDAVFIGLSAPRDVLYDKINSRVDDMFKEGLLAEVEDLYKYKENSRVLKSAIGYKEVIDYLDKVVSYDEMIDLIKQRSRRYAKRQFTWFNNKMNVLWFDADYSDFSNTIKSVEEYLKEVEV